VEIGSEKKSGALEQEVILTTIRRLGACQPHDGPHLRLYRACLVQLESQLLTFSTDNRCVVQERTRSPRAALQIMTHMKLDI
jgi:hypothetical protein